MIVFLLLSCHGVGASEPSEDEVNDLSQEEIIVTHEVVYVWGSDIDHYNIDYNFSSPSEFKAGVVVVNSSERPKYDWNIIFYPFDEHEQRMLFIVHPEPIPDIARYELNPNLVNVEGPLAEQQGRHTMSKSAVTIPEERSTGRPSGGSVDIPRAEGASTSGVAVGAVLLVLVAVGLVFFLNRSRDEPTSLGWLQAPAHLTVAGPSEEAEVPEVQWDLTAMPEWLFEPPEDESGGGFAS
jgi:hypothetical protein